MPRKIDTSHIVLEDMEWTDPRDRTWRIAGDADVEGIIRLIAKTDDVLTNNQAVTQMADLLAEVKRLFATRHTAEELKELHIPAAHAVGLALGIINNMAADIQSGAIAINPRMAQALLARSTS